VTQYIGQVIGSPPNIVKDSQSVIVHGADPTGVNDSSAAIRTTLSAAAQSGNGHILFPAGKYKVESSVVISNPVHFSGDGINDTTIIPALGSSGGKLFAIETDDALFEDFEISGSATPASTLTANAYALFGGDANTKFKNHIYRNIRIRNWTDSDGNSADDNLLVSHAFYIDNVDDVTIEDCAVDNVSGAGTFIRDVTNLNIKRNHIKDAHWYPIHLEGGGPSFLNRR